MKIINKLFFLGDPKRKIILIDPNFQLKIITRIAYFFLFIIGVFYSANWYFFYQLKTSGIKAGIPLNSEYFTFITNSSRQFNLLFFVTALIAMLLIYYFGLILSHRIAGPLFKINQSIDEMIKTKKKTKITLRQNDYFQDHAVKINELLEEINEIK